MKIFLLFLLAGGFGCSSSLNKVSKVSGMNVDQVLLSVGFKVRHPVAPYSCDPYLSYFAPSFSEPLFKDTLACLNGIKEGNVTYSYVFEPEPHLVFQDSSPSAACMKKVFPQMKWPRELYFVGKSETRPELECYAVNLDTEAGEFADIQLPWGKFKLEMRFPLSRKLITSSDLQVWLMANLLEAIRGSMKGSLRGSLVTESLCRQCYGDTPWFDARRREQIPAVYWP